MKTLTPKELTDEWAKKKTRTVYYLYGEETSRKESAVKRLEEIFKPEAFNLSSRDAGSSDIGEALGEAQTAPMLADVRFVVIKRAEKLKKEPLKQLLAYLGSPCPSACLIILADWGGKADPLFNALPEDAAAADFSPMNEGQAEAYLNAKLLAGGVKTDSRALEMLIETLGTASASLDSEAEKIIVYMFGQDRVFDQNDAVALAGFSRDLKPFELSNAIVNRNIQGAAAAALLMLANGEEALGLLAQVSRSVETMLKVKRIALSGEGQGACYQAGISPGQYFRLKDSTAYSEDKLLRSMRRCLEAEELLKSSSKRDPGLVVRQLILEITGGK